MNVTSAESGQEGLDLLARSSGFDVVIDGHHDARDGRYETIRRIRARTVSRICRLSRLTAKAMKGDRESCIAAGASGIYPASPSTSNSCFR